MGQGGDRAGRARRGTGHASGGGSRGGDGRPGRADSGLRGALGSRAGGREQVQKQEARAAPSPSGWAGGGRWWPVGVPLGGRPPRPTGAHASRRRVPPLRPPRGQRDTAGARSGVPNPAEDAVLPGPPLRLPGSRRPPAAGPASLAPARPPGPLCGSASSAAVLRPLRLRLPFGFTPTLPRGFPLLSRTPSSRESTHRRGPSSQRKESPQTGCFSHGMVTHRV